MMIFPLFTDVVGHLKSKKGKNTNFLGTSQIIRFQKLHRNFENQDNHNNVSYIVLYELFDEGNYISSRRT